MSETAKIKRPLLTERYENFLSLSDLNELIQILEIAYIETRNEKVYSALTTLNRAKAMAKSDFLAAEELYQDEELQEFFKNPGAFPHSVITWMMYYRDQEMSS